MSDFWQEQNRRRWDGQERQEAPEGRCAYVGAPSGPFAPAGQPCDGRAAQCCDNPQAMNHLQCHIGLDTLNWARKGARVTGLDYSGEAVRQARKLAAETGLAADFVEADVYDAREAIGVTREAVADIQVLTAEISHAVTAGEGTLGKIIKDPKVYDDLVKLIADGRGRARICLWRNLRRQHRRRNGHRFNRGLLDLGLLDQSRFALNLHDMPIEQMRRKSGYFTVSGLVICACIRVGCTVRGVWAIRWLQRILLHGKDRRGLRAPCQVHAKLVGASY